MPKKGELAREALKNTLIQNLGENYLGVQDKKIYVKAQDGPNGEWLQFAISMTMPKTPYAATADTQTPEMSAADKAAVERLKQRLGII